MLQATLAGTLRLGEAVVDFHRATVRRAEHTYSLSLKELLLLHYLAQHADAAVAREELLREALDFRSPLTRTLDMHVSNLRRKIEETPGKPRFLVTVPGVGYRLNTDSV